MSEPACFEIAQHFCKLLQVYTSPPSIPHTPHCKGAPRSHNLLYNWTTQEWALNTAVCKDALEGLEQLLQGIASPEEQLPRHARVDRRRDEWLKNAVGSFAQGMAEMHKPLTKLWLLLLPLRHPQAPCNTHCHI
jgi:hypothetical protein